MGDFRLIFLREIFWRVMGDLENWDLDLYLNTLVG